MSVGDPTCEPELPQVASGWDFDHRFTYQLRWLVFPAVFLVYLGQTASGVAEHSNGAGALAGYVLIGVFCIAYLAALQASRESFLDESWRPSRYLVAMVVIAGLESAFAHEDAFVMLIYVVVLAISRLGARALPVVVAAVAFSTFVPAAVPSWDRGIDLDLGISMAVVSLSMWAFFGVIRVNRTLGEARAEMGRLAAENERNRIARDLHDLLGHSLTTVTVKAGLARRLAETDPARAAVEIAEVEALARQSLADVRAALGGYRQVTVAGELASGRELLRAAGIDARFPGAVDDVADAHQELFGWVVREGITNVVRHARATRCEIRLGPGSVEVADDGPGTLGARSGGSGLAGLRERVQEAGGTVTSGPGTSDSGTTTGWLLRVEVPVGAPPAAATADPAPVAR